MSERPPPERPPRGKTVPGTSAKRARAARRLARLEAQRSREGAIAAPAELTAPADLERLAREARGLPPADESTDDERSARE